MDAEYVIICWMIVDAEYVSMSMMVVVVVMMMAVVGTACCS